MTEPRDKLHNVTGRLFQARMWRGYAMDWLRGDPWVSSILRVSYADCMRRARVNLYLARRLNRRKDAIAGR